MRLEPWAVMMTNAPDLESAAPDDDLSPAGSERPRSLVGWALTRLQQGLCGLQGHDALLQYERNRIFLKCTSCGHETPGWEIARAQAPTPRPRADAAPGERLVVARRVA